MEVARLWVLFGCISLGFRVLGSRVYICLFRICLECVCDVAELAPALELLGEIEEKFVAVSDLLECTDTGRDSNIYVSASFDATSHFESATQDVLKM